MRLVVWWPIQSQAVWSRPLMPFSTSLNLEGLEMGSSISSCISGKEIEREDRKWNLKSLSASFNILSSLGRLPGCWDSTAASTVANTYDLQTFKRGTFQKSHLFLPWPEVSVTLLGPPFHHPKPLSVPTVSTRSVFCKQYELLRQLLHSRVTVLISQSDKKIFN